MSYYTGGVITKKFVVINVDTKEWLFDADKLNDAFVQFNKESVDKHVVLVKLIVDSEES